MAGIIKAPQLNSNKEFRDWLADALLKRMFKIILYRADEHQGHPHNELEKKINSIINGDHFPVGIENCQLIGDQSAVALAFDKRSFLMRCVGKERVQGLNKAKENVEKVLKKIEDVLGSVPVAEELRQSLTDYQAAVAKVFDYNKEE